MQFTVIHILQYVKQYACGQQESQSKVALLPLKKIKSFLHRRLFKLLIRLPIIHFWILSLKAITPGCGCCMAHSCMQQLQSQATYTTSGHSSSVEARGLNHSMHKMGMGVGRHPTHMDIYHTQMCVNWFSQWSQHSNSANIPGTGSRTSEYKVKI